LDTVPAPQLSAAGFALDILVVPLLDALNFHPAFLVARVSFQKASLPELLLTEFRLKL
jgi:hypothetical protein